MPKDLKKEIENHLATFPERHQDFLEMRDEWNEFKRKSLLVLISMGGSILAIGVWVGTMNSEYAHLQGELDKVELKYPQYETRLGNLEINNGEIKARLSSIEATLQEIKIAVKAIK